MDITESDLYPTEKVEAAKPESLPVAFAPQLDADSLIDLASFLNTYRW